MTSHRLARRFACSRRDSTQTTWFRDCAGIGTDPRAKEERNPTSSLSVPRGILALRTKSFSLWASRALPSDDSFPCRSDR